MPLELEDLVLPEVIVHVFGADLGVYYQVIQREPHLSIQLREPEPLVALDSRPAPINVLLPALLLLIPPHPRRAVQQRHQGHEGVVGRHEAGHHTHGEVVHVIGEVAKDGERCQGDPKVGPLELLLHVLQGGLLQEGLGVQLLELRELGSVAVQIQLLPLAPVAQLQQGVIPRGLACVPVEEHHLEEVGDGRLVVEDQVHVNRPGLRGRLPLEVRPHRLLPRLDAEQLVHQHRDLV
mmetsp:Transcript_50131/g.160555  ORF Transcript_50131/g.160555 Transcript_50131/m.160555 type:complete len:236 (+) Transcript_50131:531-1238(+)